MKDQTYLRVVACTIALLVGLSMSRAANFTTERFATSVILSANGEARFHEVISVTFLIPQHGISRVIPEATRGAQGIRLTKVGEVTALESVNGGPVSPVQTETSGDGDLTIRIGDPSQKLSGSVEYQLDYTVLGATTDFQSSSVGPHTEFYWNVIPAHWATAIQQASFDISFPRVTGPSKLQVFYGTAGSSQSVNFQSGQPMSAVGPVMGGFFGDGQVKVKSAQPLHHGEGMTAVLAVPLGVIASHPEYAAVSRREQPDGISFAFMIGGAVLPPILYLVFFRDRLPFPKPPVHVAFEAPAALDVLQSSVLLEGKLRARGVLAGIIALAQKGQLKLHQIPEERGFSIVLLEEASSGIPRPELGEAESVLLEQLQPFGPEVFPNNLKVGFPAAVSRLGKFISAGLQSNQLRRQSGGSCLIILNTILFMGFGGILAFIYFGWPGGVGVIIGATALMVLSLLSDALTPQGREFKYQLDGLKEFITRSYQRELNTFAHTNFNQALYDRLLPYAVMFGAVQEWSRAFRGIDLEPPEWYEGYDPAYGLWDEQLSFGFIDFSTTAGASIDQYVEPSVSTMGSGGDFSSGSSGFDGGGFSDGGGGGGGGDSW